LIPNEIKISVNQQKLDEDKKWGGLKGNLANTRLSKEDGCASNEDEKRLSQTRDSLLIKMKIKYSDR